MKTRKNTVLRTLILFAVIFSFNYSYSQGAKENILNYINSYKHLAVEQMILYRIPASVIMAQAIKESGAGKSQLAAVSNNHFGIKCHKEWGGDSINKDDDSENECFRKYASVENSFLDHSLFLLSRPRYQNLFNLNIKDYKAWCLGLKECGYATSNEYSAELIELIEKYALYKLDNAETICRIRCSLPELPNNKNLINTFDAPDMFDVAAYLIFGSDEASGKLLVRNNTKKNTSN